MVLKWTKPLSYSASRIRWLGCVSVNGRAIEISGFASDAARLSDGDTPPAALADKIDRLAAEALDAHVRDLATIAPALADLYNDKWKLANEAAVSPETVRDELQLNEINIYEHEGRDVYGLFFKPPERFDGYQPGAQVQDGNVISLSVVSPLGPDCQPLLPYPGIKSQAKLPQQPSTKPTPKVPLTRKSKKFAWVEPLAYDNKSKNWRGRIPFRRSQIEISLDAPREAAPHSWAEPLLGRILACLPTGVKEVSRQMAELYNEAWAEDGELSATAISRKIRLESLDVCDDESWSMWFADGDLFGGHWIRVDIEVDGEVSFELCG